MSVLDEMYELMDRRHEDPHDSRVRVTVGAWPWRTDCPYHVYIDADGGVFHHDGTPFAISLSPSPVVEKET